MCNTAPWKIFTLTLLMFLLVGSTEAQGACDPNAPQLIIYHAGSVTAAFAQVEQIIKQQTEICVTDVAAGRGESGRRGESGQGPWGRDATRD